MGLHGNEASDHAAVAREHSSEVRTCTVLQLSSVLNVPYLYVFRLFTYQPKNTVYLAMFDAYLFNLHFWPPVCSTLLFSYSFGSISFFIINHILSIIGLLQHAMQ